MSKGNWPPDTGEYASPACYLHEVDPRYSGLSAPNDEGDVTEEEPTMKVLPEDVLRRIGQALLRDLPDAVICSDRDGLILYWNAGAERIFGFAADEALGQSLDLIVPERLRARHWQGYRQMMATGQSSHGPDEVLSVPALTKSGETRSIQFTLAPVLDAAGGVEAIVAVLRDATETFAELKRLRAAAPGQ
jgi:PAS domain S-box-containing protein